MSTKRFNPLLDNKDKNSGINQITASENIEAGLTPLSPVSGKPMTLAKCREIPVWVDLQARLVLPHRKND